MKVDFPKLFVSLAGCFLVSILGSIVTIPAISSWYLTLDKPVFNPPNWIFGPVWTILYFLIGISLYLIWSKKQNKKNKEALQIFILQLFLNFTWSLIFFGLHQPLLAFINIIALWFAILSTILKFHQISKFASVLLIPYLLWVSFASILNLAIVILNK